MREGVERFFLVSVAVEVSRLKNDTRVVLH